MFNLDRDSLVLSVGGGAVSDCVGFAASCYKRGVNFSSLPTTLLSMVDASIGGKRAVNLNTGKNQVGSFYPAKDVFINSNFLDTLSKEQMQSGFCEILKCGFLEGENLYKKLNDCDIALNNINELIDLTIKYKQNIVAEDYFDRLGLRAVLNYGHTLAHAIEAYMFALKPSHGLCVALGMDFAAYAFSNENVQNTQRRFFDKFDISKSIFNLKKGLNKQDVDSLIAFVLHDKKYKDTKLAFVCLKDIGTPCIKKISQEQLRLILLKYMKKTD